MSQEDRIKKFTFLYEKAVHFLKEQYDSYKVVHTKTATFIGISVFIFPYILTQTNFTSISNSHYWIFLVLLIYLNGLRVYTKVLFPRNLYSGKKLSLVTNQFDKELINILKEEIVALEKAFQANQKIITKINQDFKSGTIQILVSILILCLVINLPILRQKPEFQTEDNSKSIDIMKKTDVIFKSGDPKEEVEGGNDQSLDSESVPSVDFDDLETFTKGEENDLETK